MLFLGLVAALGVQRLFELRLSRRNERSMRQRGGLEHAPETYRRIVTLHAAWFASMLLEVFAGRRTFHTRLAAPAFGLFAAGQALRLTAIRTLGWRWSTRIMTVPGEAPVRHGIYRYIRKTTEEARVIPTFSIDKTAITYFYSQLCSKTKLF